MRRPTYAPCRDRGLPRGAPQCAHSNSPANRRARLRHTQTRTVAEGVEMTSSRCALLPEPLWGQALHLARHTPEGAVGEASRSRCAQPSPKHPKAPRQRKGSPRRRPPDRPVELPPEEDIPPNRGRAAGRHSQLHVVKPTRSTPGCLDATAQARHHRGPVARAMRLTERANPLPSPAPKGYARLPRSTSDEVEPRSALAEASAPRCCPSRQVPLLSSRRRAPGRTRVHKTSQNREDECTSHHDGKSYNNGPPSMGFGSLRRLQK